MKKSNILTDQDVARLGDLGRRIQGSLVPMSTNPAPCDVIPSRCNRLAAVELMKEYLELHDFTVTKTTNDQ